MRAQEFGRAGRWLLHFGAWYALLLFSSIQLSLFEQLERPVVATVDALITAGSEAPVSRRLELVREDSGWSYSLQLHRDGTRREVVRRAHAHAYLLLLLVALVLATPGLAWRKRSAALAVGGFLSFTLAAGLLLADAWVWELEAFPDEGPAVGPLSWLARGFDALHRSGALALLPLLLWLLYLTTRTQGAEGRTQSDPERSAG